MMIRAEKPDGKWLTDITESVIPAGKVYLSTIVDCFDGILPYCTASTTSDAALVNDMLDSAVSQLGVTEHPIVHSGMGCHYRWPGWTSRMEKAGLERSMSKKGCSPDSSACEGLFDLLKTNKNYREMYNCQVNTYLNQRSE
jgi:transposase InsO family protein